MSRTTKLAATLVLLTLASACSSDPEEARKAYIASGDKFVAENKLSGDCGDGMTHPCPNLLVSLSLTLQSFGNFGRKIGRVFGEQDFPITSHRLALQLQEILIVLFVHPHPSTFALRQKGG